MPSTLGLVEEGVGYTVLSETAATQRIGAGPHPAWAIVDPVMTRQLMLATSTQRPMSVATRLVTRLIRDQAASAFGKAARGEPRPPSPSAIGRAERGRPENPGECHVGHAGQSDARPPASPRRSFDDRSRSRWRWRGDRRSRDRHFRGGARQGAGVPDRFPRLRLRGERPALEPARAALAEDGADPAPSSDRRRAWPRWMPPSPMRWRAMVSCARTCMPGRSPISASWYCRPCWLWPNSAARRWPSSSTPRSSAMRSAPNSAGRS